MCALLSLCCLSRPPPLALARQTPILLWDFHTGVALTGAAAPPSAGPSRALLQTLLIHKVAIQAVEFSTDGEFLASLGGIDDNTLTVWETGTGRPVVCTSAGTHAALSVAWLHGRSDRLVTAGQ
jgi:WD40 repeat protein